MPSARKLIAVPPTIWSARRVMAEERVQETHERRPPRIPMTSPSVQVPVTSEPQTAKNAPVSIMPSSPMLTTPERSENRPPREAKTSGVAYRSVAREQAAPDDDGFEVLDARTGREVTDQETEDAGSDCVASDAPFAADPRADADGEPRTRPITTGAHGTTNLDRGKGDKRGTRSRRHAGPGDGTPAARQPIQAVLPWRSAVAASQALSTSRTIRVSADEEDDEPLDDDRQARRELGREDLGIEVPRGTFQSRGREEQRSEPDADGRVTAEQSDGDPDEADRRSLDVGDVEPELPAQDVEGAGEPGESAGDRHGEEVVAGDADPAVPRGLRVEADRTDLVPERRAVEQSAQ